MGHRADTTRRRLVPGSAARRRARLADGLSIEEQIQAAADRYEADIRAAGARYEAAMNHILTDCQPESGPQWADKPISDLTGD